MTGTSVERQVAPDVRRRNRVLLIVLLAASLAVAAGGVLYLRHYGFAPQEIDNRYH